MNNSVDNCHYDDKNINHIENDINIEKLLIKNEDEISDILENIYYKKNHIKDAIKNNKPIENKLNVIIVISNPCNYKRRYILAKEFIKRITHEESNVRLFIVELAYGNQKYYLTKEDNANHLQLRTEVPLWHKENMINLAVKYLLPKNYKAFAWIDADIEFESSTWVIDTLKILNGTKDIVQLFSHAVDMDKDKKTMSVFNSAGYQYNIDKKYKNIGGINYWHTGYAWAMTRNAYEKIDGLYDIAIIGSADYIMMRSIINSYTIDMDLYSDNYMKNLIEFQDKAKGLNFGYIPGVIKHHFHGNKKNRKYYLRNEILKKYKYSPDLHITKDEIGLIIPTKDFPEELKNDIFNYFLERNDDEFFYK